LTSFFAGDFESLPFSLFTFFWGFSSLISFFIGFPELFFASLAWKTISQLIG
jgi:predicted membrane-bound mannosyltransferase